MILNHKRYVRTGMHACIYVYTYSLYMKAQLSGKRPFFDSSVTNSIKVKYTIMNGHRNDRQCTCVVRHENIDQLEGIQNNKVFVKRTKHLGTVPIILMQSTHLSQYYHVHTDRHHAIITSRTLSINRCTGRKKVPLTEQKSA